MLRTCLNAFTKGFEPFQPLYCFLSPRPLAPQEPVRLETPYSQTELLEYHQICRAEVDALLPALDLEAESGFYWLPFNKLELQFYNIRHIQHHTGQLSERLRTQVNLGLPWSR